MSKQILLLAAFIISVSISLFANTEEKYYRDIKEESDGITVTYTFPDFALTPNQYFPNTYNWIIPGFGLNEAQGFPGVPFHKDTFTIPEGYHATISLIDSQFKTIDNINLAPANPVIFDGDTTIILSEMKDVKDYFPSEVIGINHEEQYRGINLIDATITPLRYCVHDKKAQVFSLIKYKIEFIPNNESYTNQKKSCISGSDGTERIISNIINNWKQKDPFNELLSASSNLLPITEDRYLIITSDQYSNCIDEFVDWKQTLGYMVFVESRPRGQWTVHDVEETVRQYLEIYDIKYLLIVGNTQDVPAQSVSITYNNDTKYGISDYQYSLPQEGTYLSQIMNGRIPVDNTYELQIILDKVINYEKNPVTDNSFYHTGINCTEFISSEFVLGTNEFAFGGIESHEYKPYTLISENIRKHLRDNFNMNIKRIYYANNYINPLWWNQWDYSNGANIPSDIRKNVFNWNGNTNDILNSINAGALYVFKMGNENDGMWANPNFETYHINTLSNANKLPIVFSIDSSTGCYQTTENCFAERFLKNPNGGCVAIFANSALSLTAESGTMGLGMIDAMFPTLHPSYVYNYYSTSVNNMPSYELGEIMLKGKAKLNETFGYYDSNRVRFAKEILQCFGDPSMHINTNAPLSFSSPYIYFRNGRIFIESAEECQISVYDRTSNTVYSISGTSLAAPVPPLNDFVISLKKHNHKPYVWDSRENSIFELLQQNENIEINSDSSRSSSVMSTGVHLMNNQLVEIKGNKLILNGSKSSQPAFKFINSK